MIRTVDTSLFTMAPQKFHLAQKPSNLIFAAPTEMLARLTHGVMVALQILVLSVKVRILMGQRKSEIRFRFFYSHDFNSVCQGSPPTLKLRRTGNPYGST